MAKLEIQGSGMGLHALGHGVKIFLDGHEITGVRGIRLEMNAGEVSECELTITPDEVDVDAQAMIMLNAMVNFEQEDGHDTIPR